MDYFNLRAVAPTRAFFEHSPESGKVLRNAALTLPFSILDKDIIFNWPKEHYGTGLQNAIATKS